MYRQYKIVCINNANYVRGITSKMASTALGLVGIARMDAGCVSGYMIENGKSTIGNISTYDFTIAKYFWLGAAIISVVLALLVWNAKAKD